jgi:hypothetical protein
MNEVQLIQSQLALERRHALEVAAECAAAVPSPELRHACAEYLEQVLGWCEERERRLATLQHSLPESGATPPRAPSGEAQRLLAGARSGGDWIALAEFLRGGWAARREALEQWLAARARIADWRAVSALTADVILKERELYARTRSLRPSGAAHAGRVTDIRRGRI